VDYASESADARLARRAQRWTPADLVTCDRERADGRDGGALIAAFFAELDTLLGEFDPAKSVSADPAELAAPGGAFLVMREAGRPLACGGLKTHAPGIGEIKRMFTAPDARGRGLARDLLFELEEAARELGMERLVLDTAAPLAAAVSLYASAGYVEVPAFNENPYAARWFEKRLVRSSGSGA
jgi:GNAT superfamily N-acetyltransferase